MEQQSPIVGTIGGYQYHAGIQTQRPAHHYTPRIIAWHQQACIPGECGNILWWGE